MTHDMHVATGKADPATPLTIPAFSPLGTKEFTEELSLFLLALLQDIETQNTEQLKSGTVRLPALAMLSPFGQEVASAHGGDGEQGSVRQEQHLTLVRGGVMDLLLLSGAMFCRLLDAMQKAGDPRSDAAKLMELFAQIALIADQVRVRETMYDHSIVKE